MSLDLFCNYLTLINDSYNNFRLNNCEYGLVGHKDGPGDIGKGGGRNIGCRSFFVYSSVVFSLKTKLFLCVTRIWVDTHPVMTVRA